MLWKLPKTKQSGSHRWVLRTQPSLDELTALKDVPPQIGTLLWQRGVRTKEAAEVFFADPTLKQLPDPFGLTDMDKAVERLMAAKTQGEQVVIYGDNDPDGACGAALLLELMKELKLDASVYIPDPTDEGHGISDVGVEEIIQRAAGLVITVDTGVNEHAGIAALKEHGIDTIVLDHHVVPNELPLAVAVVDSRRPKEPYGSQELSGTTVAHVFAQAVYQRPHSDAFDKELLIRTLDLVAIALIADVIPLTDVGRMFMKLGLKQLRRTKRAGLLALFSQAKIEQGAIDTHAVAFDIAPRLNAVAASAYSTTAVDLLMTNDIKDARRHAKTADSLNRKRQKEVKRIVDDVDGKLRGRDVPPIVIERDPDWTATGIRIAASRVRESFSRPVFLCAETKEGIRCSARSPSTFNLVDALNAVGGNDLFDDFGGHPSAAGCTIRGDWWELFVERMGEYAKAREAEITAPKSLEVDMELQPHEIVDALMVWLERFEPYGQGNRRPKFQIKGLEVVERKSAGLHGSGTRLKLVPRIGGRSLKAVSKNSDALPAFRPGDIIDVVCELRLDRFRGREEIVLALIDTRHAESEATEVRPGQTV